MRNFSRAVFNFSHFCGKKPVNSAQSDGCAVIPPGSASELMLARESTWVVRAPSACTGLPDGLRFRGPVVVRQGGVTHLLELLERERRSTSRMLRWSRE
jgi:hypothetical protein